MRANHIGDLCEYSYYLAMYFSLYFAYAIVGFHYFGGLDKYGSAGGRFVVNYTANFSLVHRRHRQHQASVSNRRRGVFVEVAILASLRDDASHYAIDARCGGHERTAQFEQFGRSRVLHVAEFVENARNFR